VIRLERVAVNIADFTIPDNEGARLADDVVAPEGLTALPATLPLRAIEQALLRAGIPARLSTTAGTFLCNATMYTVLQAEQAAGVPSGFVHLPHLAEQVARLCEEVRAGRSAEPYAPHALASMSRGPWSKPPGSSSRSRSKSAPGPRRAPPGPPPRQLSPSLPTREPVRSLDSSLGRHPFSPPPVSTQTRGGSLTG